MWDDAVLEYTKGIRYYLGVSARGIEVARR